MGTGGFKGLKMLQQLRALTLAEYPGSAPSTHMHGGSQPSASPVPEKPTPFDLYRLIRECGAHGYT